VAMNDPCHVINDVPANPGASIGAGGKYALYLPRPGRNVDPAATLLASKDEDGEDQGSCDDHADVTCPPTSGIPSENIAKARTAFLHLCYEHDVRPSVRPSVCNCRRQLWGSGEHALSISNQFIFGSLWNCTTSDSDSAVR